MKKETVNTLIGIVAIICAILFAIILTGCSARKPIKADATIPISCVNNIKVTPKTTCYGTSDPEWATCDGVLLHYECISYRVDKRK